MFREPGDSPSHFFILFYFLKSGVDFPLLVFRVSAGVDDAVHVQVQVVELHLVGVRFGGVHGDPDPVTFFPLKRRKTDG